MASYTDFQARRQAFMNPRPISAVPAVAGAESVGMTPSTATMMGLSGPQPLPTAQPAAQTPEEDLAMSAAPGALLPDGTLMAEDGSQFALPRKAFGGRRFGEMFVPYERAVNTGRSLFQGEAAPQPGQPGWGAPQEETAEAAAFDPFAFVAEQNAAMAQPYQPVDPKAARRDQLMSQMFPRATAMHQRLMQARMTPPPTKREQPPQLRKK